MIRLLLPLISVHLVISLTVKADDTKLFLEVFPPEDDDDDPLEHLRSYDKLDRNFGLDDL